MLVREILCCITEAQNLCQTLLRFLSEIALTLFLNRCNNSISFEKISRSNFSWRNMGRIFSAVYLSLVISKSESEAPRKVMKSREVYRVSVLIKVDDGTVRKVTECFQVQTSGLTPSAKGRCGMERCKIIDATRKQQEMKCGEN